MRGTFANIRLRNEIGGKELIGGLTLKFRRRASELPIYDAAMKYAEEGTPLVVLAGKEYGSGSSRDWAAKGTNLLGVKAVIAQSFERIHRSNLVGMGVLPLQFPDGESAESLGLTGEEEISITGIDGGDAERGHGQGRATRSSPPACASTRRRSATTTSTAASCSSCCASWWPATDARR